MNFVEKRKVENVSFATADYIFRGDAATIQDPSILDGGTESLACHY